MREAGKFWLDKLCFPLPQERGIHQQETHVRGLPLFSATKQSEGWLNAHFPPSDVTVLSSSAEKPNVPLQAACLPGFCQSAGKLRLA